MKGTITPDRSRAGIIGTGMFTKNIFQFKLEEVITLREIDSRIVAVLNPNGPGDAFFHAHPAFRESLSLADMLEAAERKLCRKNDAGKKEFLVWVNAADEQTRALSPNEASIVRNSRPSTCTAGTLPNWSPILFP